MIVLPWNECFNLVKNESDYVRIGFRKIEHAGHLNLLNDFLLSYDRKIVAISEYFCKIVYGPKTIIDDQIVLEKVKNSDCVFIFSEITINVAKQANYFIRNFLPIANDINKRLNLPNRIFREMIGIMIKDEIEEHCNTVIGQRLIIPYMFAKVYFRDSFEDRYIPIFRSFRNEDGILYSSSSSIPKLSLTLMDIYKSLLDGKTSIHDFSKLTGSDIDVIILDMKSMDIIENISEDCFILVKDRGNPPIFYDFITIMNDEIIL